MNRYLIPFLLLLASTATAQDAKNKPGTEYATGLVVPEDIKQRHKLSWQRHGARLMATPTVLAERWDAADFGLDSPVDDQGSCGSCHLFAATGGIENAQQKEGYKSVRLSKQHVMNDGNTGDCNGGWPEDTMAFAKKVGIATTDAWTEGGKTYPGYGPYAARRTASKNTSGMKKFKLKDYGYVAESDTVPTYQQIKDNLVKWGTLPCAVAADNRFMNADPNAIFAGSSSGINHAVMIVGYDDNKVFNIGTDAPHNGLKLPKLTAGAPALKIKNSWSVGWCNNGYVWMKPGANRIGFGAMFCVAEDTLPDPVPPGPTPPDPPVPPPVTKAQMILRIPGQPDQILEVKLPSVDSEAAEKLRRIEAILNPQKKVVVEPECCPQPTPEEIVRRLEELKKEHRKKGWLP